MGLCTIKTRKESKNCFGYLPELESPANIDINEAIKYYEAIGFKKVDLSENVKDGDLKEMESRNK